MHPRVSVRGLSSHNDRVAISMQFCPGDREVFSEVGPALSITSAANHVLPSTAPKYTRLP